MRINHHLSVDITWNSRRKLSRIGIDLDACRVNETASFGTFDIDEGDPRWPALSRVIRPLKMLDVVSTQFNRGELLGARACAVNWRWQEGYPQPEGDGSYLTKTYDTSSYCASCGMGLLQKAPFRMKGEPRWGKRSFLALNWIQDEIFTTPDVWQSVFEPIGVKHAAVWHPTKDTPLKGCVQLVVEDEVELNMPAGHPSEQCTRCGRTRWAYFNRGVFPGPSAAKLPPLFKSQQYFGSGHASHKQLMVSAELYQMIEAQSLTGLGFAACAA